MQTTGTADRRGRPLLGLRRRPGRVALAVFRLPLVLYRHGWGWLLGTTFMLLVHVGRRTGHPHPMTAMVLQWDASTRAVVIFSAWGPSSDWVRNLRAGPALRVQVGRESYQPRHRFLTVDESVVAAHDFVRRHPRRLWLARRILAWPDLRAESVLREFVRTHPFVELRPSSTA